jgi:hypothetical protein
VLQGVSLAKVLNLPRVSVFEFGVAGGSGLVSLERVAELVEQKTGVGIDVYGFDTGEGFPLHKIIEICPTCGSREISRWTKPRCGAD